MRPDPDKKLGAAEAPLPNHLSSMICNDLCSRRNVMARCSLPFARKADLVGNVHNHVHFYWGTFPNCVERICDRNRFHDIAIRIGGDSLHFVLGELPFYIVELAAR